MEDAPLASFSLTHIHYNPHDRISYLCAWLALVPQELCMVYATLIWSTREIEIIFMFIGQMTCEVLNWGLKRWIKEERPPQMNGKGYGMPSSHAQFVTFFSLSLSLFLLFRHKHSPNPSTSIEHSHLTLLQRGLLSLLSLLGASLVAASRMYLNYHTRKQVLVGVGAGATFALLWFGVTTWLRSAGWVQWGLETWVARVFRVRDLVVEEDLVEAGWQRWMERRKLRFRKQQ
ncbi:DOLPP1 protein [Patellaria atrata CBS 101060]|uniref:Dolichyldiphosphatase n=1 Tax=Patellaria atrata CBS 101060 TaxID=1346257 RepID=A0A9P4VPQ6_9PEZI|nr:DOLPP1 protein [Patellaria atrata CBS 101060]